jgi:hypothetical protein
MTWNRRFRYVSDTSAHGSARVLRFNNNYYELLLWNQRVRWRYCKKFIGWMADCPVWDGLGGKVGILVGVGKDWVESNVFRARESTKTPVQGSHGRRDHARDRHRRCR